jgi:cobaltochelatase CobS
MTSTTVTAGQRRRSIRQALRSHPDLSAEARSRIAAATMNELLAMCANYGIDPDNAVRDFAATSAGGGPLIVDDVPEATETETTDSDLPTSAEISARVAAAIPNTVRDIMDGLLTGGAEGVRARVEELLTRAETPRVVVRTEVQTVERIVERRVEVGSIDASKIAGHVPRVTKTEQANKVLETKGLPKGLTLDVYDAPDAPGIDPHYTWPQPPIMSALLSQMSRGRHVMLWGPAGTGKTSFAEQIAARTGRPFVTILCDRTTDKEPLVGMLTPKGWQNGLLSRAIRRPGTLILIDEPSAARAGALLALNSVLGPTRDLYVQDTGERIVVAPGVLFVLADNTGGLGDSSGQYEDTGRLNRSTLDRIGATHEMGYLPAPAEARVLSAKTGAPLALAELAVNYASLTRDAYAKGSLSHAVGVRRLLAWCELIVDGADVETAYNLAIHNAAPHDDRESLRQLYRAQVDKSKVSLALTGKADPLPNATAGSTELF